jgi:hypothetical protein
MTEPLADTGGGKVGGGKVMDANGQPFPEHWCGFAGIGRRPWAPPTGSATSAGTAPFARSVLGPLTHMGVITLLSAL